MGYPRKARVPAYHAEEKYGLVWVCLEEPHAPVPSIPEIEDPAYHTFVYDGGNWATSGGRMVDNFIDFSHFPWGVRTSTLTVTDASARLPGE